MPVSACACCGSDCVTTIDDSGWPASISIVPPTFTLGSCSPAPAMDTCSPSTSPIVIAKSGASYTSAGAVTCMRGYTTQAYWTPGFPGIQVQLVPLGSCYKFYLTFAWQGDPFQLNVPGFALQYSKVILTPSESPVGVFDFELTTGPCVVSSYDATVTVSP